MILVRAHTIVSSFHLLSIFATFNTLVYADEEPDLCEISKFFPVPKHSADESLQLNTIIQAGGPRTRVPVSPQQQQQQQVGAAVVEHVIPGSKQHQTLKLSDSNCNAPGFQQQQAAAAATTWMMNNMMMMMMNNATATGGGVTSSQQYPHY